MSDGFNAFGALAASSGKRGRSADRQPVVAFGAALMMMIWSGAALLLFADYQAHATRSERDAISLAQIGQQNALGVLDGVDKRLKFLRWVERESRGRADWPALLSDRDLAEGDSGQIAVVDVSGLVVASSMAPHLERLVDIGDRPYFTAQRDALTDELFLGPAIESRPGGQHVIQISRKRFDLRGKFAGVFVYSLPADYFDQEFANLDVAPGGGLALVGDDGQVRAGAGVYADGAGRPDAARAGNDSVYGAEFSDDQGYDASRRLGSYPLSVVAHLPAVAVDPAWRLRQALVVADALLATVLTLLVTRRVARARRRIERELLQLSRCDGLTGLVNRRSLSEALDEMCAREDGEFALHVLDLDRFKLVNDSYGHLVGDELLKQAADRLAKLVGKDDLVARLGGDEFAILQRVSSFEAEAPPLARKVNRALAQPFPTSRMTVSIGATVGVARGRVDGTSAVELLQAADLALYAAKADGRGGARVFHRQLTEAALARMQIEAGLRTALAAGEFQLAYQPVYSLERDILVGYEALLRWRPDGGDPAPSSAFIPIAEELGLIVDIGAWALRQACADIAALSGELEVAVNVSAVQLDAGDFAADVAAALRAAGLAPRRLRVEITESTLLQHKPVVADQLRALRALGVGVSLDDFGAGYSCLSYLEMYPIDTLKIDQRFVAKLDARAEAVRTLRAIVDLARSYGMETVAEGVETPEQLEALRQLGCERAQGYLLGRPGPLPVAARAEAA